MNKGQIFNFVSNSYTQFLSKQNKELVDYSSSLEPFRQPINESNQIYLLQKKYSKIYQLIFFGLSLLFFSLGAIVYFNTTNWACSVYFQNCVFIKSSIYMSCLIFGIICGGLSYFLKPEIDSIYLIVKKAEKKLKELYKREVSAVPFFNKQTYYQSIDKIRDQKEKTIHLIERINTSKTIKRDEKEDLIHEALLELQNILNGILKSFKQKNYLHAINHNQLGINLNQSR